MGCSHQSRPIRYLSFLFPGCQSGPVFLFLKKKKEQKDFSASPPWQCRVQSLLSARTAVFQSASLKQLEPSFLTSPFSSPLRLQNKFPRIPGNVLPPRAWEGEGEAASGSPCGTWNTGVTSPLASQGCINQWGLTQILALSSAQKIPRILQVGKDLEDLPVQLLTQHCFSLVSAGSAGKAKPAACARFKISNLIAGIQNCPPAWFTPFSPSAKSSWESHLF